MAGWKCWFFEHKWTEAMDPELETCERCDKLRRKPKVVPAGAHRCPWPNCTAGWSAQPPRSIKCDDGKIAWVSEYYAKCTSCGGMLQWNRTSQFSDWSDPVVSAKEKTQWFGYNK